MLEKFNRQNAVKTKFASTKKINADQICIFSWKVSMFLILFIRYDDEYDDTFDSMPAVSAGAVLGDQSGSDEEGDEERWANWTNRGKGGKAKGGKGKSRGKGIHNQQYLL